MVQVKPKYDPVSLFELYSKHDPEKVRTYYWSIPIGWTVKPLDIKRLNHLATTKIVLIDEKPLVANLSTLLNKSRFRPKNIISISDRGEYVYSNLVEKVEYFRNIRHLNIKTSRTTLNRLKLPTLTPGPVLVLDDIFCTGMTLSRVIELIGSNHDITCGFLYGPGKLIENFSAYHKKVKVLCAKKLPGSPFSKTNCIDLNDIQALIDSTTAHKDNPDLLKNVFSENNKKAINIIKRLNS